MGWDALFDFLGAGGGLLILLQWLSGIPRRRLELKRDRKKTFRELLDDDMEQMNELMELYKTLQDENIQIQNRVSALERVVLLIEGCPTYHRCPARRLVQDYKAQFYYARTGQPRMGQKGQRYPRDNPTKPGDTPGPDGQPP